MLSIRTWAASKNSDLYTTPGLDTGVKNSQMLRSGIRHQINKFHYASKENDFMVNSMKIYKKYSIGNNLSSWYIDTN